MQGRGELGLQQLKGTPSIRYLPSTLLLIRLKTKSLQICITLSRVRFQNAYDRSMTQMCSKLKTTFYKIIKSTVNVSFDINYNLKNKINDVPDF